jgi:hypothetical protein
MVYLIGLGLTAFGLVLAIPAFLSWIDLVTAGDITAAFEQAKQIFARLITGSLITVSGIGLIIWKTLTSRNRPTVSISGSSGVNVALAGRDAVVKSTIKDLQQSANTDIKKVANLLLDLKATIDAEPNLPTEAKADALEQINVIGESVKEASENVSRNQVKNAIRILKSIAAEVPHATQFIGVCNTVLPQIASLVGLI